MQTLKNIIQFTKNVKKLLAPNGVFIIQTGYHPDQMKINMFDWFYHEHYSYFSVKVLNEIFHKCDLELIAVKKIPIRGGCIRIIVQHKKGPKLIENNVENVLNEEKNNQIENIDTYLEFNKKISKPQK